MFVVLLGLLLLAPAVRAVYQFDIRVEDMAVIDCWNPATCVPVSGSITIVNNNDPNDVHVIPCTIHLGGSPLAYSFTGDADWLADNCEGDVSYTIVERRARFCGPGFGHNLVRTLQLEYPCGTPFPVRIVPLPDTGCDVLCDPTPPSCLDWANFPDGVVSIHDDLVLEALGEELCIDPGMRLHFQPGSHLIIEGQGELLIRGTAEAPIILEGENWGGVELRDGARLELRHVRISGVSSEGDGGALEVGPGSEARLFHCILDHNSCAGAGGAAVVREGGLLFLDHCTVADNAGGTAGGVFLAAPSAEFESSMSILAWSSPEGTELTGSGFARAPFTDVFPQGTGFPPAMVPPLWNCAPGFVDRAAGDYRLSWLAPGDSSRVNCVVDVWNDPLQLDPDGTPGDMGALPLDQRTLLLPPSHLTVEDWPGDQGGWVRLRFQAAPQDGTPLGPVLGYSLWMRPPGHPDWLSLGFLAATGDPEAWLETRLPTWRDATEEDPAPHQFRVAVHAVQHPAPAFATTVDGSSLNDLAPPAVTGLSVGEWYYDAWPPTMECVDVWWDHVDIEDLLGYVATSGLSDAVEESISVYQGPVPRFQYCVPHGTVDPNDSVHFWVRAVDTALNAGPWVHVSTVQFPLSSVDGVEAAPAKGMEPAWPNPFNPLTRIRYHLGASGPVRLTAWNAAGQRVALLVDGDQAAGAHELVFDGRGLASGVYYIRLEAAGHAWTERLLLLR
jgi:hypothetical protein